MGFGGKLKVMRKQAGMSQERLAEKLGVSRQAVTKWEADAGIPDIENIMAISGLFDISIDELLGKEKQENKKSEYLFESITEYDIDEPKRYDMKFGGAKQLVLSGYDGEKIRIRLASDQFRRYVHSFEKDHVRLPGLFEWEGLRLSKPSGTVRSGAAGGTPAHDPPHPHHRQCARLIKPPAESVCNPL